MLAGAVVKSISNNINKYAESFRNTGDLKWFLRYAQEASLYRKFTKAKRVKDDFFVPLNIDDFLGLLKDAAEVPSGDEVQDSLNQLVASALLRHYVDFDGAAPAFKTYNMGPIADTLSDPLLVQDNDDFDNVRTLFLNKVSDPDADLSDEIKEVFVSIARNEEQLRNAIDFVLTVAYLNAYSYVVYSNPILTVLDPDQVLAESLTKTAAGPSKQDLKRRTPSKRGPRLSDLLNAVRITSGKFALSLRNTMRQIDAYSKQGIPTPSALVRQHDELLKNITYLDAYIDYLTRLKNDLQTFMTSNIENPYLKYGGGARDYITDNPLVRSGIKNVEKLGDLFRAPTPKKLFEVDGWDGAKVKFSQFGLPQNLFHKHYAAKMGDPSYQKDMASSLSDNARLAQGYFKNSRFSSRLEELKSVMPGAPSAQLVDIYDDISKQLSASVPNLSSDLEGEGLDDSGVGVIESYESDMAESTSKAKALLGEKYAAQVGENKGRFNDFLDKIIIQDALPLTPLDLKGLSGTLWPSPAKSKNVITETSKNIFPVLHDVLDSGQFRQNYIQNESDMIVYEEEHAGGAPSQLEHEIDKHKKEISKAPILRDEIGIINLPVDSVASYKESFGNMINDILFNNWDHTKSMLDMTDIPVQALYAYLGDQYMAVVGTDMACKIACQFGGAREKAAYQEEVEEISTTFGGGREECMCFNKRPPNPAAYEEAQYFVNDLAQPREKKRTTARHADKALAQRTVPGMLEYWHKDPSLKSRDASRPNLAAVISKGAQSAFGAHIRDNGHKFVKALFIQNKELRDAAIRAGKKLDWDDPSNPLPTSLPELAHVTGAFADPIPSSAKKAGRFEGRPDEAMDVVPDDDMYIEGMDTASNHLKRLIESGAIFGLGTSGAINPVREIREGFFQRKQKIINDDERYEEYIVPYDIENRETDNPRKYDIKASEVQSGTDLGAPFDGEVSSKSDAEALIRGLSDDLLEPAVKLQIIQFINRSYPSNEDVAYANNASLAKALAPLGAFINIEPILSELGHPDSAPTAGLPGALTGYLSDITNAVRSVSQIVKRNPSSDIESLQKDIYELEGGRASLGVLLDRATDFGESELEEIREDIISLNKAAEQAAFVLDQWKNIYQQLGQMEQKQDQAGPLNLLETILNVIQDPSFHIADVLPADQIGARLDLQLAVEDVAESISAGRFSDEMLPVLAPQFAKVVQDIREAIGAQRLTREYVAGLVSSFKSIKNYADTEHDQGSYMFDEDDVDDNYTNDKYYSLQ